MAGWSGIVNRTGNRVTPRARLVQTAARTFTATGLASLGLGLTLPLTAPAFTLGTNVAGTTVTVPGVANTTAGAKPQSSGVGVSVTVGGATVSTTVSTTSVSASASAKSG